MPKGRIFKRLPTAQSLKDSRILKPFARWLDYHYLWQFNRRGVAIGVAVGLFFGFMVPFAQIFFAALFAILLRANLPVAAFSTLVTNPLTFPPIYYLAYRIGDFLTGAEVTVTEVAVQADIEEVLSVQQGDVTGWFPNLVLWMQSVGWSLLIGLSLMAVVSSVLGYLLVNWIWKWNIARRWRKRRRQRA